MKPEGFKSAAAIAQQMTWEKDWIHNGGALVGTVDRQGQVLHAHLDHLGSPRVFSNANGISVRQRHFHPFGELAAQSGTAELTMGFTGHERDENTAGTVDDLDYMHARYYSPQMGRFLSTDPINSADPKRPGSWNKYAYALNNPMGYFDPTGMAAEAADGSSIFCMTFSESSCDEEEEEEEPHELTAEEIDRFLAQAAEGDEFAMLILGLDMPPGAVAVGGPLEFLLGGGFLKGLVRRGVATQTGTTALASRGTYVMGRHALERMAERGISREMMETALRSGNRYWDPKNKTVAFILEGGMASGKHLLVAQNPVTSKIATVLVRRKIPNRMVLLP